MYHGEWFCGSVAFVSTFEAKAYPFYGTQWHPEKNGFVSQKRFLITHTHTPSPVRHTRYICDAPYREGAVCLLGTPEQEWTPKEAIPHSAMAVRAMQSLRPRRW